MRSLRRAPRVTAWALLALAVLLAHGLLLHALRAPPAASAPLASTRPGVALRLIVLPAPVSAARWAYILYQAPVMVAIHGADLMKRR